MIMDNNSKTNQFQHPKRASCTEPRILRIFAATARRHEQKHLRFGDVAAATLVVCYGYISATVVTVVMYETDLRCTITLEDFEQYCCAQAKSQPHHQAGTEDIEKPGKNGEHCCALQLDILAKSLTSNIH